MSTRFAAGLILVALLLNALLFLGAHASSGVISQRLNACMSLAAPDVLFCTDARDRSVICIATGKPACQTTTAMYRSWRGHPERREEFFRRLYGATP